VSPSEAVSHTSLEGIGEAVRGSSRLPSSEPGPYECVVIFTSTGLISWYSVVKESTHIS
jgi:hypothetical protein